MQSADPKRGHFPSCYPFALLAALESQRSSGSPLCDVLVKCGQMTSPAHSCVLAAASGFFQRVLNKMSREEGQSDGERQQMRQARLLEVGDLFVGVEHLFHDILTFLYLGRQGVALNEEVISSLAAKLDLRPWKEAKGTEGGKFSQSSVAAMSKSVAEASKRAKKREEPDSVAPFFETGDNCKMDVSFCRKCDLLFISKEEFVAHRMLDCTRKFTCRTCGSMFTRVQSLLDHLAEVRHGETICSVCMLALPSSTEMEAHLARHLAQRERPYFCPKCESRFATRNALDQHLPKHSSETPFICQVCNKG